MAGFSESRIAALLLTYPDGLPQVLDIIGHTVYVHKDGVAARRENGMPEVGISVYSRTGRSPKGF